MANKRASKKSIRQTIKRTERNRQVRSKLKTMQKKVAAAAQSGNAAEVKACSEAYISALDKAVKINIVHPNKASRHKSAVSKHIFQKTTAVTQEQSQPVEAASV
ncbi:MAG: 30S ribosomal protein S20 [Verrucomicrobia bacterium GWF2_51_19]|nr:MAG: 30S ribosomal protein S20 [Verrucomicrobia bacterium GWF2_51_19]HCJ12510.1 30S ribosomal protein S20 [Opitutae bacterium]